MGRKAVSGKMVISENLKKFLREWKPSDKALKLAQVQTKSLLISALCGKDKVKFSGFDDEGRKVWSVLGPRPFLDAVFVNSTASVVYDWDDYLFAGHTGHSTVFIALATAELFQIEDKMRIFEAIALGNEVGARLGVLALVGPLNGQMMSFLHSAISSTVFLKLVGEDEERICGAIANSLSHPTMPTVKGFFAGETKFCVASLPTIVGIFTTKIKTRDKGQIDEFFREYCWSEIDNEFVEKVFDPNQEFSKTLSFKLYPGCAYVQSAVECALQIKNEIRKIEGEFFPPLVQEIQIEYTPVSAGMDTLSERFATDEDEESFIVKATFSTPLSVVLTLLSQKPNHRMFSPEFLDQAKELCSKTKVSISRRLTKKLFEGITVKSRSKLKVGGILNAIERARYLGFHLSAREIFIFLSELPELHKSEFDLENFRFNFGCRLKLKYAGRWYESECITPPGAKGGGLSLQEFLQRKKELAQVEIPYEIRRIVGEV